MRYLPLYHSAVCNSPTGVTPCSVKAKTTHRKAKKKKVKLSLVKVEGIPVRPNRTLKKHKYISLFGEKLIHALKSPVGMGNVRKMENGRSRQEREHVKSPVLAMVSGCAIKTLPVIHLNIKEKNREQRVSEKGAAAHTKGTVITKCAHKRTTLGQEFPDLTEFLFHNPLSPQ